MKKKRGPEKNVTKVYLNINFKKNFAQRMKMF